MVKKLKTLRETQVSTGSGFFTYSAWPSICKDEKGVLYVVCSGNRINHMCPFGRIILYKSRDNGKTWSAPVTIKDSFLDDRDPSIIYLGNGRMLMMCCNHPAEVYEKDFANWIREDSGNLGTEMLKRFAELDKKDRLGGAFVKISQDFGETWSDDYPIPVHCPHGPVILENVNIFIVGKEMYSYGAEEKGVLAAYESTDRGETFQKVGTLIRPNEYGRDKFHEPHCVELDDGRIMALIRSHILENDQYFTIYKSISSDGGKSWSVAEPTGICGSPPHLLKLKSGKIVLTYARRAEPYGIYGRMIENNGKISDEEFLIDSALDDDIGYPASVELDNGDIITVYYMKKQTDNKCRIYAKTWQLD